MCSRAEIYDRAAVLGQRVQVLVCQLAELQDLRDRVLRTAVPSVVHRAEAPFALKPRDPAYNCSPQSLRGRSTKRPR